MPVAIIKKIINFEQNKINFHITELRLHPHKRNKLPWRASFASKVIFTIGSILCNFRVMSTCDMIKGNESDVGNIDFELHA